MIINSAPQNEAIVSNVGEIGEFRIRNSAKAFNILSSGLYANKIRAIIRELSCNAVDSHVAAGKQNTPFDVHLPNQLEPYFSIRDYGTGLSHDQVTNIYTTYFESTKTASNEFIGALGLGSKSPFSYTDNFTVTAVKDNRKGVYTAFINEQGVPSIALMMEEETTDPAGVEVRFAVTERYDFEKFRSEARSVYKYFKQRPVVSGSAGFEFTDPTYLDKDIIPGVHHIDGRGASYAIMGNIAYPIEVPQADTTLGELRNLLQCGLVIEFDIGDLDFQASREGLSYIPQTIESIKRKLEQLNTQLAVHIEQEASKITNTWEKALYLDKRYNDYMWQQAVKKYVTDTKFEYLSFQNGWNRVHTFKLVDEDLKKNHNILIRGFQKSRNYNACTNIKARTTSSMVNNQTVFNHYFDIGISNEARFVINDTKVGCTERAKYHTKESDMLKGKDGMMRVNMYVVEAYDKTKPIDVAGLKTLLANPPESYFMKASDLLEKERSSGSIGKNVTIMRLEERGSGGYYRKQDSVWRDAGKADSFSANVTYYYIPLSGFQSLGRCSDVKALTKYLQNANVFDGTIYGVRKTDIEYIKLQKNWVELDTHIIEQLNKMDKSNIMGLVKQALDIDDLISYNSTHVLSTSPFAKLVNTFKDVQKIDSQKQYAIEWLSKQYDVKSTTNVSPQALIDKYKGEANDIIKRYPLLKSVSSYSVNKEAVAEYINLIDQSKGV
jgi:hypothetical protein